jgi:sugar phosphate permease
MGVALGLVLKRSLMEPERGAADLRSGRQAERIPTREFLRLVWGTPTVLLLMAAFLCANFVAVVLLSWMPKFLYDRFHLSLAAAGLTATVFVQLASMAGSPLGGWLADTLRKRTPGGRLLVQAVGVFGGAPFVVWCALAHSVKWLIVALIAWGFFKGLYDANIFASVFDVIRPEARGTAAGFMNMTGWMGGGVAPLAVGYVAQGHGLGFAIASAAAAYVAAGGLLLAGVAGTVKRDAARIQAQREGESL